MLNDKVKGSEAPETLPLIEDGRESRGTQSTPSSQNTKQEARLWEEKLKIMENDFRKPKWRKKHFQLIPGNSGNWTRNLLRDRQKIYQRPKPALFVFFNVVCFHSVLNFMENVWPRIKTESPSPLSSDFITCHFIDPSQQMTEDNS